MRAKPNSTSTHQLDTVDSAHKATGNMKCMPTRQGTRLHVVRQAGATAARITGRGFWAAACCATQHYAIICQGAEGCCAVHHGHAAHQLRNDSNSSSTNDSTLPRQVMLHARDGQDTTHALAEQTRKAVAGGNPLSLLCSQRKPSR